MIDQNANANQVNRLQKLLSKHIQQEQECRNQISQLQLDLTQHVQALQQMADQNRQQQQQADRDAIEHVRLTQLLSSKEAVITSLSDKLIQAQLSFKNDDREVTILQQQLDAERASCQQHTYEIQALRLCCSNLELRNEELLQTIQAKSAPQIIYIQNEAKELLDSYEAHQLQEQQLRLQLNAQLSQLKLEVDRLHIANRTILESNAGIQTKWELERAKLESKIKDSTVQIQEFKQAALESSTKQEQYEQSRVNYERQMNALLEERNQLIANQAQEIGSLKQRVSSSNTFVLDTLNSILPTQLDDYLQLKKEHLIMSKQITQLQQSNAQLTHQNEQLEQSIASKLPYVAQRQREYDVLLQMSQDQKLKLEQQLQLNLQIKQQLITKEHELNKQIQKVTTYQIHNEAVSSENTRLLQLLGGNTAETTIIAQINTQRLSLEKQLEELKQQKQFDNEISVPAQQLEQLQQDYLALTTTVNNKDEIIGRLQDDIKVLEMENSLKSILNQGSAPIVHKIQKVKSDLPKQQKLSAELRKLQLNNRQLKYDLQSNIFELDKTISRYQFERQQREFVESNLRKLQVDYSKLRQQLIQQQNEFEMRIKSIQKDMEIQGGHKGGHHRYVEQNKKLYEGLINLQQELDKQQKRCQEHYEEAASLKQQLANKELHINALLRESQSNQSYSSVALKIQIENQTTLIRAYEEQLKQQRDEMGLSQKRVEETSKVKDKKILEELHGFVADLVHQNQSKDTNQFENVAELKESILQMQKSITDQTQRYVQTIEQMKQDFSRELNQKDEEIQIQCQNLEELIKSLDNYKQLYEFEILEKQKRQNISKDEFKQLQEELEQVRRKRNELQKIIDDDTLRKQEQNNIYEKIRNERQQLQIEKTEYNTTVEQVKLEVGETYQKLRNMENLLAANEHTLQRRIEELYEQLGVEQDKVNRLLPNSQMVEQEEVNELKDKQNELIQLQYEIDKAKQLLIQKQLTITMENPPTQDFNEERKYYENQIEQLKQIREGIKVEDVKLVKDLVQDGRLLLYLEKAKQIYDKQSNEQL